MITDVIARILVAYFLTNRVEYRQSTATRQVWWQGIPAIGRVEWALHYTSRCFSDAFLGQSEDLGDIIVRREKGDQEQGQRWHTAQEGATEAEQSG